MTTTISCPSCQQSINTNAEYCPHCDQEFCPSCQAPIDSDASSCQACGVTFSVYCPECEADVEPDAIACEACGYLFDKSTTTVVSSRSMLSQTTLTQASLSGEGEEDDFTGECPECGTPLYMEDGYCGACEATFCTSCGKVVDEDDEICPHCNVQLFFDCPLCGFELTAGTDLCANCNALFLSHCSICDTAVQPLDEACSNCSAEIVVEQRTNARVVHTLVAGVEIVRVFACTECGTQYDSRKPECPTCGERVCTNCQIILKDEEEKCPRCRLSSDGTASDTQAEKTSHVCPTCEKAVESGSDQCPHCDQLLCPTCLTAVKEDDESCPKCGTEFEFICPNCEATVSATAESCPQCSVKL